MFWAFLQAKNMLEKRTKIAKNMLEKRTKEKLEAALYYAASIIILLQLER